MGLPPWGMPRGAAPAKRAAYGPTRRTAAPGVVEPRGAPTETLLLVLSAATGEFSSLHLGQVSTRSWLALAYLIVIGSIVAFSAYGIANRLLPTATVATYAYVNPVIAVLLGTLILGENLTTMMIIGGVLIVGAVVLVVRRTPPSH